MHRYYREANRKIASKRGQKNRVEKIDVIIDVTADSRHSAALEEKK